MNSSSDKRGAGQNCIDADLGELFPFGHGLRYTGFGCSCLCMAPERVVEPGVFDVLIGSSSAHTAPAGEFEVI